MLAPLDLTTTFTASRIDWTSRPRDFSAQFPDLQSMRVGVYAILTTNRSDLPIHDRNNPSGLMASAQGSALKSGKFEQGFCERIRGYYHHFHRRTADGEEAGIFPNVLRNLLVLDLTKTNADADKKLLRAVEKAWNQQVRNMLRDGGWADLGQTGHSESRLIVGDPPPPEKIRNAMQALADNFAGRL